MRIENVRLSGGFKIAKPSLEDFVRATKRRGCSSAEDEVWIYLWNLDLIVVGCRFPKGGSKCLL